VLAVLCCKALAFWRINQAFEKYNVEKDVAEQIKKEFDKRHGPTWHCIVGRNFGNSYYYLFSMILVLGYTRICGLGDSSLLDIE